MFSPVSVRLFVCLQRLLEKVSSDFHATLQDYGILLREDSVKFHGCSYSKRQTGSHIGFLMHDVGSDE